MQSHNTTRRTVLKATGASLTVAAFAGCLGSDDDDDDGNAGNEDDGGGGVDEYEIDPDTEIVFDGQTSGWVGKAPSEIEGVENPTLVLQAGETYTIGWDEGDGGTHNIELRDSGGSVVGDYQTGFTNDSEPDDQFIEFEATDEIAVYRCDPHAQMEGDIVVE